MDARDLIIIFGEWPFVCTMAIATYLSFEYWRFPDLTVEGSFVAGTTAAYVAFTASSWSASAALVVVLSVALAVVYALATWSLVLLRFPPLFAGFVVMIASYTSNFYLNGRDTSQIIYRVGSVRPPLPWLHAAVDAQFFAVSVAILVLVVAAVLLFDSCGAGIRLRLARRTSDPAVSAAVGLRTRRSLLLAMIIYNFVAVSGGVGFALANNYSGLTTLGAITPGLACTFILRAVTHYMALPSRRRPRGSGTFILRLIWWSDSLRASVAVLVVLSAGLTFLRFRITDLASGTLAVLNAYTAIGIIVFWTLISLIALLFGKPVAKSSYGPAQT